jgi:AAA+ superfamily predicted ATPase
LAEAHDDEHRGYGSRRDSRKASRRVDLLLRGLERTLQIHTEWKLGALFSRESNFDRDERVILLALIGKEIGHFPFDDKLFLGGGLARAASPHTSVVSLRARMLLSSGRLQRATLIQPCGGCDPLLSDDENNVVEVEFELASRGLELFGLDRRVRRRKFSRFNPRTPVVRLEQLVLPERASAALRMALAHARHSRTLLDDWGFAEVLPYGRTIGILLAGPPGVGKTASAEAIAHELGRQILAVDYSEVQNCYTGQTEKNIVRIFREARANQAVLFWDEADAMFYDRNSTQHTWETRDVNVLLQELERFEGVCILATNRKVTLDAALSRRISIKIEFERPDRALRLRIWKKSLPRRLPLEADVNLDHLAQADLTGGEIKNVTVNAARLALLRGGSSRVSMADFEGALQQELENRWGMEDRRPLGFRTRGED